MLAEVSLSWNKAHADHSSARPNHACSSQLQLQLHRRVSNSNQLNPGLLNSHHPLARQPVPGAQPPSYPISHRIFIITRAVLPLHLLRNNSRNNPAMPLHLAHLLVVPVQHRHQAARGLQRPLRVMDGPQQRLRRAILYCATERRLSIPRTICVRNVRPLPHVSPTASPTFYPSKTRKGQNTGYKNNDPSHPCRKCWDRFSKLFTSILASSPWSGQ